LLELLNELKKDGKKIVGISAPAKGNTLLNYCKIDSEILDYVTERNPFKIGKFTPGMHIPVYSDEKLLEDQPDYALILAWNFADEIIKNNSLYQEKGGKFIIPTSKPKII
jgi:ABC-type Fe3+-hydroxamate transport system substrate-binding protein